jgi:trans-aconitate methyltransferase
LVIGAQGGDKKILDIGCGHGYSTAVSEGSVGVDEDLRNIKSARRLFPEKTFKLGISSVTPHDTFDVVTCMFYFHRTPQFIRKMIIANAVKIAVERVIIVDISPDYTVGYEMYKQSTFMEDYYENCRNDLSDFTETTLVDGMLSIWVYDVPIADGEHVHTEIDEK